MKLRRIIAALLCIYMTAGNVTPVLADGEIPSVTEENSISDFTYAINPDGLSATITGYTGSDTEITVPEKISSYTITSIGDNVFEGKLFIKSVILPDTITEIGSSAFSECEELTNITLPASLISIGDYAFKYCCSLSNLKLPETLTTIGESAFWGCSSIQKLTIPASVNEIGSYQFYPECELGYSVYLTDLPYAYFKGDVPESWGEYVFNPDVTTIYYPEGNLSGWTAPTWEAPDGCVYNTATWEPVASTITTTFDQEPWTIREGISFSLDGKVTTTAERGLNNLQVNITNAETGIGGKWFRVENIGTSEYDLSAVPFFTAGETITVIDDAGYTHNLALTVGTSWNIQLYATDMDGNALGSDVVKKITIRTDWAPDIIGLQGNYTITAGSDLSLIFSIQAKEGCTEISISIIHYEENSPWDYPTVEYNTTTINNAEIILSGNDYPLNAIGTHNFYFVVATKYSHENENGRITQYIPFNVTVTQSMDVETSTITTTYDTTETTLAESTAYNFAGTVTTTAEGGLNNLQVNITNADTGIGGKWFRAESIGTSEYDLSAVPSFIAGEIITVVDDAGVAHDLELTAGTSWYVQLYATDMKGNSIGGYVVKQINITENPNKYLIGNKYIQTSYADKPYIQFNDNYKGEFYIMNYEPDLCGIDYFTYTVDEDMITLIPDSELGFNSMAQKIVLQIIDNTTLKIVSFEPETIYDLPYSVGYSSIGDTFEAELYDIKSAVECLDTEDYAGNYRDFIVTFDSLPTNAYLQFDNQYSPDEWLSDEYCSTNPAFMIDNSMLTQTENGYTYKTTFIIHSEGLANNSYLRKVRVACTTADGITYSEPFEFYVYPIPDVPQNKIGYAFAQTLDISDNTELPAITAVVSANKNGYYRLTIATYTCDDKADVFFYWEADSGEFQKVSDDFSVVDFIPDGNNTVTAYMGDGLGYVASYTLNINQ